ncbi:phosphotransferase family protein [Lihuaxuella thermophila]|uniref:Predicted kinase, aminoglycoside phosphotransferase (APT) family n=1 Tax=Lihuaxuella thermophila TaxID=1173111 RepID=A0A1H8C920_9BACL|nr:phosphotransferase family protein [Lihuaxuella thermophila]SEM91472.1 Predicted kinase, aminoglycoside phosphotransferase (APT) family [Lihuaxuella thermophila]
MADQDREKWKHVHQDTIAVRRGEELNLSRLEHFLRKKIEGLDDSPLKIRQFPSGASNLTYLLSIGDWEAVLRRPPLGPVAPKAHDMAREYKILSKLHPVFPLAPKPYLFSDDEEIIGSPFFLMERRRGVVLDRGFPKPYTPTREICRQISQTMVDRLADLHRIDYEAAGLSEIGFPEGFMKRQVTGWIARYERARTDEIEGVEELKKWMMDHLPASPRPAVIHYDYKLNNVMFDYDDLSKMIGIFDWEMATIGDPLADLGCALSYWTRDEDPDVLKYWMGKPSITLLPGFMSKEQLIEAYARKSGRDVSQIHFYLTFAYFKLAVIIQQIYYRWKRGQTKDERFANFGDRVRALMNVARELSHKKAL